MGIRKDTEERTEGIAERLFKWQVAIRGQCGSLSRGVRSTVRRMCGDVHSHEIESEIHSVHRQGDEAADPAPIRFVTDDPSPSDRPVE